MLIHLLTGETDYEGGVVIGAYTDEGVARHWLDIVKAHGVERTGATVLPRFHKYDSYELQAVDLNAPPRDPNLLDREV